MSCPNCSAQEFIRHAWSCDPDLQTWVPVCNGDGNRFFEDGLDLSGVPLPYVVLVDSGVSDQKHLGDHVFFEDRGLSVRIYADNKQDLLRISRRFRLVFSNIYGEMTDDGCITGISVSGSQTLIFPDGVRLCQHNIVLHMAENRGPARLRATTVNSPHEEF